MVHILRTKEKNINREDLMKQLVYQSYDKSDQFNIKTKLIGLFRNLCLTVIIVGSLFG